MTSRDFQRAAGQRLIAAQVLLENRLTLDAFYLAGYVIECSFKTLILRVVQESDREAMWQRITSGAHMHRAEVLVEVLKTAGVTLPAELARKIRRFKWSTALRYHSERIESGEARGFLKAADAIHFWVEGQLS